jgi:hypothetical protein
MKNTWKTWDKDENKRFIILTDMENEPDDSQTMVKLLMYSNEIDIEGLIAVTSCWLQNDVFPESIEDRIEAFNIVRTNLEKHAKGWPTREELMSKVAGGQKGFGMDAVGDGKSTKGSNIIIQAVDKDDPRPIYFSINAGANTLAQALWDVKRDRNSEEVAKFISKLKVYDDSGQDNAGAWIVHTFPDLFYVRNYPQVYSLFGPELNQGPQPWKPLNQYQWAEKHIRTRHGVLGALYPQRIIFPEKIREGSCWFWFMDGGGTTGVIGLVNKGLFDPEMIEWGGWGGRFSREKRFIAAGESLSRKDIDESAYTDALMYPCAADSWYDEEENVAYGEGLYIPLWRWRKDILLDFQARMDWCLKPYEEANHHPRAVVFGDDTRTILEVECKEGTTISLDGSASYDPDGDTLNFKWYQYPEAGTYKGKVDVNCNRTANAELFIPEDAKGSTIHIIFEVSDNNSIVSLKAYRRIVITVK